MSEGRPPPLLRVLRSMKMEILEVESCRQARNLLETCPPVELVITAVSLCDGNWCDVMRYLVDHCIDAGVVLACSTADERLWSEAVWRGVYDLLVEPYRTREVRQIIEGAVRAARQSGLARRVHA